MTQEQDIVERLLSLPTPLSDAEYRSLGEEAAQTIAALRAEVEALNNSREQMRRKKKICEQRAIEAEADLTSVSLAIGSNRFMDPPDGGSVTLAEQVSRMRQALEVAEAKVKELEAELERKHQNPTDYRYWEGRWRDTQAECDTAIRERDEARKALEPFAKQADRYDPVEGDDDHPLWGAHTLTIGDVRRARSASSNREGGEE